MPKNKNIVPFPGSRMAKAPDKMPGGLGKGPGIPKGPIPVNPKNADPQMTVEVRNDRLKELIDIYAAEQTQENLSALVNHLLECRVLVPGKIGDKQMPVPVILTTSDGKKMQAVFTDKQEVAKGPKAEGVLNLPFAGILSIVLSSEEELFGIAINPFGQPLVLRSELLKNIGKFLQKKNETEEAIRNMETGVTTPGDTVPMESNVEVEEHEDGSKTLRMTEAEYVVFERERIERTVLPMRLFSTGQEFIDELINGRGECLDKIFDENFKQNRLYPYIPDDFKVTPINIAEDLTVIRIDMPDRDIMIGVGLRIYICWNPVRQMAGFFMITKGAGKDVEEFHSVNSKLNFLDHGETPVEGTELGEVIRVFKGERP